MPVWNETDHVLRRRSARISALDDAQVASIKSCSFLSGKSLFRELMGNFGEYQKSHVRFQWALHR